MTPEEIILEMNWTFDSDPGRFQLWEQLIKPAMIRFASLNRQGWTGKVKEVLEECRDYMEDKADVGYENEMYFPNKEASLLVDINAALTKLDATTE